MIVDPEALFAAGGPLAAQVPGFEPRPQQVRMAAAVRACLEEGRRLVVEAPTGVGKSLAYLLPGALWACQAQRRLVISTHTRALQEQLVERELPVVAGVLARLGIEFRFALLMGGENYLCVQRLARSRKEPGLFDDPARERAAERLWSWSQSASTGLRSKLPELVAPGLWGRIHRDPDLCLGAASPYWPSCLYRKDREAAERSQVLVVNHALLLSNARLPAYDALIFDEAHNLEEAAMNRFGLTVSSVRWSRLIEEIRTADGKKGFLNGIITGNGNDGRAAAVAAADRAAEQAAAAGSAFFKKLGESHGLVLPRASGGERAMADSRRLVPDLVPPSPVPALKELANALLHLEALCPGPEEGIELAGHVQRLSALGAELDAALAATGPEWARWVAAPAGRLELYAVPLEAAERLRETVFGRGIPAVLTSATLASGRGLKGFAAAVGLEGCDELLLDSPFDYPTQAGLLLLDGLPPPDEEKPYLEAILDASRRVIRATPGGVFILFSSWRMLRKVHESLRGEFPGRPLWAQGDSGHEALLEEFAAAGNAVLLGVDTFWQGVDVPGEALSTVVLVKLPFPNFASPLEEARREYFESLGRSYFDDHSLPKAVMKFRQGFGRLIRSSTDRGAVVVLDSRILRKGYGNVFLEALPKCKRLADMEDLEKFFQE